MERESLVAETHALLERFGQNALQLMAKYSAKHGLTPLDSKALIQLAEEDEEIPLGRVAECIHVPPSSMTGIADRLAKAGLIERGPSSTDRRSVVARLTPKGREVLVQLRSEFHGILQQGMTDLNELELREFNALFARVVQGIEQELPPALVVN